MDLPTTNSGAVSWSVDAADGITVDSESVEGHTLVQTIHGTLDLNQSTGEWSYELSNGSDAVQSLAAGQPASDLISIRATDGEGATVVQDLTINITGTNLQLLPKIIVG